MGNVRPKLFEALAEFDDDPDCSGVCKDYQKPGMPSDADGPPRALTPCEICQLKVKRNALFRLAMRRAANFVDKNRLMDIKGGSQLEKYRIAQITIQLEFGHSIFHLADTPRDTSVPSAVTPSPYDINGNGETTTSSDLEILNSDWPCI